MYKKYRDWINENQAWKADLDWLQKNHLGFSFTEELAEPVDPAPHYKEHLTRTPDPVVTISG